MTEQLREDAVRQALDEIVDPEIGLPITELGLVYGIDISPEGEVEVTYTLTSLGCPAGPMIDQQIRERVADVSGVSALKTTIVFQPPWSPDKMSDDAKAALGMF